MMNIFNKNKAINSTYITTFYMKLEMAQLRLGSQQLLARGGTSEFCLPGVPKLLPKLPPQAPITLSNP